MKEILDFLIHATINPLYGGFRRVEKNTFLRLTDINTTLSAYYDLASVEYQIIVTRVNDNYTWRVVIVTIDEPSIWLFPQEEIQFTDIPKELILRFSNVARYYKI